MASRACWVMLLVIGPLVGMQFIDAVRTYGELSGFNGSAAGVGEAFTPLIGILAPTFSACELAAAFLLPFVVIRVVAGDQQSGALLLELQQPFSAFGRILAKTVVLLLVWLALSAAPLLAVLMWRLYGGALNGAELGTVMAGHMLNAALAIAIAAAAARITDHPSTAAITALSVTVGGWLLNFAAALNGGLWAQLAQYTPTAMVGEFQHGLVRLEVVLASLVLTAAGLGCAAVWTRLGVPVRRRILESGGLAAVCAVLLVGCSFVDASWDTSEARLNSVSAADERLLGTLTAPLRIEAHLAPEDPRRSDLERRVVPKLRRAVGDFDISYVSATTSGLFEQTREGYGEIRYQLGTATRTGRATTLEGVLGDIYGLAGMAVEEEGEDEKDEVFRGHPLAVAPDGAAVVFYAGWPAAIAGIALMGRGRGT
jgi:hypothetical protein